MEVIGLLMLWIGGMALLLRFRFGYGKEPPISADEIYEQSLQQGPMGLHRNAWQLREARTRQWVWPIRWHLLIGGGIVAYAGVLVLALWA